MIIRDGISSDEQGVINVLNDIKLFDNISREEIEKICSLLSIKECDAGEILVPEDGVLDSAFIVESGEFIYELYERVSTLYKQGDIFGIEQLFGDRNLHGARVKCISKGRVISFSYELFQNPNLLGHVNMTNLLACLQTVYAKMSKSRANVFNYMDVLIIQDGGCAPGKNPIIAFLTEYLEKSGRKVFVAAEGYRSLVNGRDSDFRCLIDDPKIYTALDHVPGVINSRILRDARGANFRSERFPEFKDIKLQQQAAANAAKRNVNMLVAIGGNGTFSGLREFVKLLPENMQVFFIPATIDSDVLGTDTVGQYTGVEAGAEKVRCYLADAYTHHRLYIVEMMGALGGYHALHSCIGAGANLAVLPGHRYNLHAINKALADIDYAVIVVAEGYKVEERKKEGYTGNAAEYFRDELKNAGLQTRMKIVCEPFSRDIRGATPNNLDITLSQSMASKVSDMAAEGKSHLMPSVIGVTQSEIPFKDITTNNSVSSDLVKLANKLY